MKLLSFCFSEGRQIFRDYLKTEYSEENILFWLACEDLKKEEKAAAIEEKARMIYEDYISILSPKEVRDYYKMDEKLFSFYYMAYHKLHLA